MISERVTLIDQGRQVVATAQVTKQDGTFTGWIDLRPMPVSLQRLFEEYEEIVNTHMFSLLDAIEDARALRIEERFLLITEQLARAKASSC